MLISRVDISSEVQEALQAGQALRLLAGQVQRAALVDLSQESRARSAWEAAVPLLHPLRAGWTCSYPVPPVDVSAVAHQQLHHVRLVSQDSDVQGRVVGDRV